MPTTHAEKFTAGLTHLDAFIAEHGHARVPSTHVTTDGYPLGLWVSQRGVRRRAGMPTPTAEQIAQLDARGFEWRTRAEIQFEVGLAQLDAFIAEHGHARVPSTHVTTDGYPLGHWVRYRRERRRAGLPTPTPEQIIQLDARGFEWFPRTAVSAESFAVGLAHLDAFIAEHGHANVPTQYVAADGYRLGNWVENRRCRRSRDKSAPTAEQIAQLDARGFEWRNKSDIKFSVGLTHLDMFIAEHRHARVPSTYISPGGFALGSWVHARRVFRRAGRSTPTPTQIALLDARGFDWAPGHAYQGREASDRSFAVGLEHLDAFIAEHGHADVSRRFVSSDGFALGSWVQTRRKFRRAGQSTPTPEQIVQLDARGFVWNSTYHAAHWQSRATA